MTKKDDMEKAKRLAAFAGTATIYEGEVVPMAELENKKLMVHAFNYADSTYREGEKFLSMQGELDGEMIVINTNAKVIMKGFMNLPKEELPYPITFYMEKPKGGGKQYWNMKFD